MVFEYVDYEVWRRRATEGGMQMTAYQCPVCGFDLHAPIPPRDAIFAEMFCCPVCGKAHHRMVRADAYVSVDGQAAAR